MTLSELFQTLKTLSKADLNSVKQFLESLDFNYNGFEDFLLSKKAENGISCPHCSSFNVKKNGHKGLMQRFMCHDCHKTFTSRNNTITFSSKKSFATWKKYIECMMNGFTVRKSAAICGINKDTAFIWRHKILDALQNMQENVTLEGIVEADEAFFPISYKGNHKKSVIFKMPRKAHKRGKQTHKRGLSKEKVCVPCAVTRNGLSLAKITNLGRVSAKDIHHAFDNRIMPNSILCTDAISCYNDLARKGKSGFPKFKSKKDNHQSYREPNVNENCKVFFENRLVKIPKVGKVQFKDRSFPKWWGQVEKLCSMTVSKSCSGNYYVSILFEISPCNYKVENRKESIGLDFSPSEMYVSSENQTGKDFGYIAQKQAHSKKLRRLQRQFARKQMVAVENCPKKISSKNREKARIKLARLEEHIANSRKDWIEKESLRLVRSYDKVVVEDLNLKGISKFLRNAKNMNDTSWATFVSRLQAKGKDYNCKVITADRYFPSSQLCSKCGFQYKGLKLSEREWTCCNCGTHHIRDVNAAINLKNYVPLEEREFTPVESSKVANLAMLALQATELDETGSTLQATKCKNLPNL